MTLSATCEDPEVTILDDDLNLEVLKGLLKVVFARGCIPLDMPLRLIKTIEDFCQICIFPFLTFQNDSLVSQSESGYSNIDQSSEMRSYRDLGANRWAMELQGVPLGILDGNAVVNFFGQ